jgi:hypothetical protein
MSAPIPRKFLGRTNIHGDIIYDFEIGQCYEINGEIMEITRIDREHGSRAQLVLENIKAKASGKDEASAPSGIGSLITLWKKR